MDAVNKERCTGCTNAVSWLAQAAHAMNITAHELRNAVSVPAQVAHAMNTTDGWMDGCMDGWMDANTVHGLPLQARVVAANRAVLANLRGDPGAHGNEQGAGICKTERGQKLTMWAVGMA